MLRRSFIKLTSGSLAAALIPGRILSFLFPSKAAAAQTKTVSRFAFGSCLYQTEPQPIWNGVMSAKPDVFAFIGDNIYADTEDMAKMKKDYEILGAVPGLKKLREQTEVIATWDDHDFGVNDGGAEYPKKKESKELFLEFFKDSHDSERRSRDGVYTSYFYGTAPNRLQVILLDLRTFRTPLVERTTEKWGYAPNPDPKATMMGAQQWAWLEDQLRQPADLRILASSVQCVSSEHEWEKWGNFPHEKERLFTLIDRLRIRNLVVVSGDMHFAELSLEKTPSGTPIYDLTASGLNVIEEVKVPNSKRLFSRDNFAHFGLVQIKWEAENIKVSLEIRDEKNAPAFGERVVIPRG